jgi:hypothetical protein
MACDVDTNVSETSRTARVRGDDAHRIVGDVGGGLEADERKRQQRACLLCMSGCDRRPARMKWNIGRGSGRLSDIILHRLGDPRRTASRQLRVL